MSLDNYHISDSQSLYYSAYRWASCHPVLADEQEECNSNYLCLHTHIKKGLKITDQRGYAKWKTKNSDEQSSDRDQDSSWWACTVLSHISINLWMEIKWSHYKLGCTIQDANGTENVPRRLKPFHSSTSPRASSNGAGVGGAFVSHQTL